MVFSDQALQQLLTGIVFGSAVGLLSVRAGFLTPSGGVATFVLAVLIYGLGGWSWTLPMLVFFVLSSTLTKFNLTRQPHVGHLFEKPGPRDYAQVIANGGVAGVIVLLHTFFDVGRAYPVYLASVAASAADTWGTEIGTLFHGKTVSILPLRVVEPGTSGGVSIEGLLGGILGSLTVVVTGAISSSTAVHVLPIVVVGLSASIVDSIVGSTLQARFQCTVCLSTTERAVHCNEVSKLVEGCRWISNDVVNLMCSGFGACAMVLLP